MYRGAHRCGAVIGELGGGGSSSAVQMAQHKVPPSLRPCHCSAQCPPPTRDPKIPTLPLRHRSRPLALGPSRGPTVELRHRNRHLYPPLPRALPPPLSISPRHRPSPPHATSCPKRCCPLPLPAWCPLLAPSKRSPPPPRPRRRHATAVLHQPSQDCPPSPMQPLRPAHPSHFPVQVRSRRRDTRG